MLCGGCAAKLGQSTLARALSRLGPGGADPTVRLGLESPDDAVAWATPSGRSVVSSLDVFRAFTDDPWIVGRVAATNAVSDLQAKGVEPRYAQALVALPEDRADEDNEELLLGILAGARGLFDGLGVSLLGGHTLTAPEILVGFHLEALQEPDTELLTLDRLAVGQNLILTKPLGTGVLFHADRKGLARGPWIAEALAWMQRHNGDASRLARDHGATAATDVTGFGLALHLAEMLRASRVSAVLDLAALPALPGAIELLERGERSTSHDQNAAARRGMVFSRATAGRPELELLFDPQTSGGLVFGVPAERADECLEALRKAGDRDAAIIGRVGEARPDGAPIAVDRRDG
jgi:selenide,water dikinase